MIETSGHDRLREAADRLVANIGADCPCIYCQHDRQTAALLRAVADLPGWIDWPNQPTYASGVRQRALALADTILGAEECNTTRMHKNPADEYPREDGWGYG